jgi:hypothetical protein
MHRLSPIDIGAAWAIALLQSSDTDGSTKTTTTTHQVLVAPYETLLTPSIRRLINPQADDEIDESFV